MLFKQKYRSPYLAISLSFGFILVACGGTSKIGGAPPVTANTNKPDPPAITTISNIQALTNWSWCSKERNGLACASGLGNATSSMTQHQTAPSLSGDSSIFWIGGPTQYSNALWWRPLDVSNSMAHFTYDLFFFLDDPHAPEALEFDVNQSFGGTRYTWGSECSYKNTGKWDIWNPQAFRWVTTSVPCKAVSANAWHHLVWQLERINGQVHYISLSLDGNDFKIDQYFSPQSNWNVEETDVAFQLDGDFQQKPYKVWLDKVNLSTW